MPAPEPLNIQPKRILVITQRYLGDTLLTTPLLSALKQAYPDAAIDVLLSRGNVGMLEGNPDVSALIPVPAKPKVFELLAILARLCRRYDLAISTQTGDRPTLYAWAAGKVRLGFVPEQTGKAWWKQCLLTRWLIFGDDYGHAVLENLRFCASLGIPPVFRLTPPYSESSLDLPTDLANHAYAVLHIQPQWRYKAWPLAQWRQLAEFLAGRGYRIVLTGSGQPAERQVLTEFKSGLACDVLDLSGGPSLAELSRLIGNAALFVGPDTGITHLAAATGAPVFALFGPTDPSKWAPWPTDYAENRPPFAKSGSGRVGNVHLIQDAAPRACLPCQLEGCERRRDSRSDCLEQLPAERVIGAIDTDLEQRSHDHRPAPREQSDVF